MKLYRLITGADDSAFCKRVSEALNKGWSLHGAPSMTYDMANARLACAQAVVKDVAGDWHDDMMQEGFKLSQQ